MFPILSKFEFSCFNYPNLIEDVGIYPNVSNYTQFSMDLLYYPNLNETVLSCLNFNKIVLLC